MWLNGCSNLIAFCSAAPEMQQQVDEFQHLLSRLMSLLMCCSLCDISGLPRSRVSHVDLEGIDPESIAYLDTTSAKQNVVLQWVQRLVVESARNGVIDVAPPILSRVFQEFSIGIVHFIDARKISSTPFPFALAQLVWLMLVFLSVLTVPVLCAVGMDAQRAPLYTFLIVSGVWSLHFVAEEIEMPFGDRVSNLRVDSISHRFNKVLERLLDGKAQQLPCLVSKPRCSVRYMKRDSTIVLATKVESMAERSKVRRPTFFRSLVGSPRGSETSAPEGAGVRGYSEAATTDIESIAPEFSVPCSGRSVSPERSERSSGGMSPERSGRRSGRGASSERLECCSGGAASPERSERRGRPVSPERSDGMCLMDSERSLPLARVPESNAVLS